MLGTEALQSGYREGIVAGKESALQAGFDDGFADIGAPLGRHLGMLRGLATGLRTFLDSPRHSHSAACEGTKLHGEIVRICEMLSLTQLSDIAPVDLEAFEHAKAHPHSASSTDHADICESREHTNRLSASQSSLLGMLSELGMGDLSNLEYVEPNFMARFTPVKDPIAEI